jgi:hypothetical protein
MRDPSPSRKTFPELRFVRRFTGVVDVSPLIVSCALAIILLVAAFGFVAGLPLAYLLVLFACWALANHFVEIIEHRATGEAAWPAFSLETIRSARAQLGLVLALLVGAVLAAREWLLGHDQASAAAALTGATLVCGPAIAALLGVTRSLVRALDPRGIAAAMVGLGLDYVLCVAAASGAAALGWLAFSRRGFIELFGALYAAHAVAFVIGTVVYDRRLKLGVHAPRSPEAKQAAALQRLEGVRRAALDHAYGIASHGSVARGVAYLAGYAATESDPLGARLWMFHEVARWEDGRAAIEIGVPLAAELNAAGRSAEAAKVLVTCRYLEDRIGAGSARG